VNEFCPDCGEPLTVENGLLYCQAEDAYKGEADNGAEEDLDPQLSNPFSDQD
jgi:hypothetical protein